MRADRLVARRRPGAARSGPLHQRRQRGQRRVGDVGQPQADVALACRRAAAARRRTCAVIASASFDAASPAIRVSSSSLVLAHARVEHRLDRPHAVDVLLGVRRLAGSGIGRPSARQLRSQVVDAQTGAAPRPPRTCSGGPSAAASRAGAAPAGPRQQPGAGRRPCSRRRAGGRAARAGPRARRRLEPVEQPSAAPSGSARSLTPPA